MGMQNIFNQFRKYYYFLFGIVTLMFITSIITMTVKSKGVEQKITDQEFSRVRSFVKFSVLDVDLLNFYYINEGMLAQHVDKAKALDLVRWIHSYKSKFDIDGGILVSKDGDLLAKTDFVKLPFNKKITSLINKSLVGELVSTTEIIPVDQFDEGLKFEFSKKASYSTGKAKALSLTLLKAYPVYDENQKIIASFVSINFINGDNKLLDQIVGGMLFDEAGIIIDSGNVVKKQLIENKYDEFKLFNDYKTNPAGSDIVNSKNRTILIPLKGVENDITGALYVKLPSKTNKESLLQFYLQNVIFFILAIIILIYGLNKIKKTSEQPYKKMSSIIRNMGNGDYKFPLLSRYYLQSIFKDEFESLRKLSKIITKGN